MALLFLDTIIQEFLVELEDNRPPAMQLAGECRDASGLYRFDQELYKLKDPLPPTLISNGMSWIS